MYSFQNPEKTLQELLTTGRAYEQTSKQMEEISKKKEVKDHQSEIFYTSNKKQQNFGKNRNRQGGVSKSCYRCGGVFPHTNKSCPAEGKTCNKCQKKNHFAAVCKTKARGNPRNPKTLNSLTHSSTSTVLYENGEDLELDETLFPVTKVTEGGNLKALKDENSRSVVAREKSNARALAVNENKDFDAVILVEGIKVSFLVDTGASINILTLRTYNDCISWITYKIKRRLYFTCLCY